MQDLDKFILIKTHKTHHQVGTFHTHIDNFHLITYGYDGLLFIHKPDYNRHYSRPKITVIPHHRFAGGVSNAFIDRYGRHIIAMGTNATLVSLFRC